MQDVIAYMYLVVVFIFGLPFGILIERLRVIRAGKKCCPEFLEKMREARKL